MSDLGEKAASFLDEVVSKADSVRSYVKDTEKRVARFKQERDSALEESARLRREVNDLRLTRQNLYDAAIREWIVRRLRLECSRDDIRNVEIGPGDPWPGTDVTPGDEDYAAIRFEIRKPPARKGAKERWEKNDVELPTSPVQFVEECLAIYYEISGEQA